MNKLNQFIIEGVVKEIKQLSNGIECTLVHSREYKDIDGNTVTDNTELPVICNLKISEKIIPNSNLRIVGYLKQDKYYLDDKWHSRIVLIAEHIEIRS